MASVLWTQRQDVGPSARYGHAMAFDRRRRRVVLFGGRAADVVSGDTYEWDGADWTQVQNAGPPRRAGHAMAYDGARERVVLFGGAGEPGGVLGDTWTWDGVDWTQLQDTGPDPRQGHAMADDPARSRVVLFGGAVAADALRGDTWEWDGAQWTQIQDTGPAARMGHAMAHEAGRSLVCLFGGSGETGPLGDTWSWDGAAWSQDQDIGPPPTRDAALVSIGATLLLFGGAVSDPDERLSGESWEWSGDLWTRRQDMGPTPRRGHAMAFDDARARPVLFGGDTATPSRAPSDEPVRDTWEASIGGATPVPSGGGAELAGFTIDPSTIQEGEEFRLVVTLSGPAPPGAQAQIEVEGMGMVGEFPLAEDKPVTVIEAGPSTFPPDTYTLLVRFGAQELTATLTVQPGTSGGGPQVSVISVDPSPVAMGTSFTVTVTLDAPATRDITVPVTWVQRGTEFDVLVPAGSNAGTATGDADPAVDTTGANELTATLGGPVAQVIFEIGP